MNVGYKDDDDGHGKVSQDIEDRTHSVERAHLSSPKKKLNDAREKAAYFEKEVMLSINSRGMILDIMLQLPGILVDIQTV